MIEFDGTLLAACAPAALLPERRAVEAERLVPPLTLLTACALGPDQWLLVVQDQRGIRYSVPAVVENGALRRAVAGDGVSETLVALLAVSESSDRGLEFERFFGSPQSGESAIEVDQTNELMRVGDAMVKWNLHPADESAPGPICATLLHRAGFTQTPQPWAHVRAVIDGERLHVASVFQYIADSEDGWDWAVADVRSFAQGLIGLDHALEPSRALGALVARMHAGLALGGIHQATADDIRAWHSTAISELDTAVDLESASGHPALGRLRPRVLEVLSTFDDVTTTPLIRIHGDLHIGQFLRTPPPHDYAVIDFDGNPTQEVHEPFQPAARDVAGMLCSLDHVARVVIRRTDDLDDDHVRRALEWIPAAESAFLTAYAEGLEAAGCPKILDTRLIAALRVQQECREYIYADRYLPHWRYVPEAALPRLLDARMSEET